jgi:hypothetical protein
MRLASTILILAACGGGGTDPEADELEQLLLASTTDCGTLEYPNSPTTCPEVYEAIACFDGAAQPHIEQVRITVEGDPIYEHFFIDNGVPVLIRDTRADQFGAKQVTRTACSEVRVLEADACSFIVCDE